MRTLSWCLPRQALFAGPRPARPTAPAPDPQASPLHRAGLLRECPAYQPSASQLRFLLRWVATDLSAAASDKGAAFGLLRAVLGRKLMAPEVYDAMDKVQEVMIRLVKTVFTQDLCGMCLYSPTL